MRRVLLVVVGALISAAALAYVVGTIDVATTAELLARVSPWPLLGAVGVLACQTLVRAFRWSVILPPDALGARVRTSRLVAPLLAGYLGNAALPARLGEPMRAGLVSRREGIGLAESLASVLLERIVDVATLAPMALVAAILVGAPAAIVQIAVVAAIGGTAIIGVLVTFGVAPVVSVARRMPIVASSARAATALDQLDRFALALGGAHRRRTILAAAGLSTASWFLDATIFWLAATALGIGLAYPAAMLISGIAVLGTAIPSAPGYVGTFELAASTVAVAVGVGPEAALALAVLAHATALLPLATGGAISIMAMGRATAMDRDHR